MDEFDIVREKNEVVELGHEALELILLMEDTVRLRPRRLHALSDTSRVANALQGIVEAAVFEAPQVVVADEAGRPFVRQLLEILLSQELKCQVLLDIGEAGQSF